MGSIRFNISSALVTLLVVVSTLEPYGAAAEQVNSISNIHPLSTQIRVLFYNQFKLPQKTNRWKNEIDLNELSRTRMWPQTRNAKRKYLAATEWMICKKCNADQPYRWVHNKLATPKFVEFVTRRGWKGRAGSHINHILMSPLCRPCDMRIDLHVGITCLICIFRLNRRAHLRVFPVHSFTIRRCGKMQTNKECERWKSLSSRSFVTKSCTHSAYAPESKCEGYVTAQLILLMIVECAFDVNKIPKSYLNAGKKMHMHTQPKSITHLM